MEEIYEIERIVSWIKELDVRKVALQFPDQLLKDAPFIALRIEHETNIDVHILGDTSYGSCCVDVHAASCINAQALIHFGPACLSKHEKLPVLYIFEKMEFEAKPFVLALTASLFPDYDNFIIATDLKYHQSTKDVLMELTAYNKTISYLQPNIFSSHPLSENTLTVSGRSCQLPLHISLESFLVIYIGEDGSTLTNLMFTLNKCTFYTYNPKDYSLKKQCLNVNQQLQRRYFLIQKAKDARLIGILVATLGVADHLKIIEHIKMLATSAGKKCYTFVVGKLNPNKLANFPEIDCFVTVACPENSLVDAKDFYRPVITPFEFEVAVNSARLWTGDYITDFRQLLPGAAGFVTLEEGSAEDEADMSLVSGQIRRLELGRSECETRNNTCKEISDRGENLSVLPIGSDFLRQRGWMGLEPHVGETPITSASCGRRGLASGYQGEGENLDDETGKRGNPDGQE